MPSRTLNQLAKADVTGALHVDGPLGGVIYLTDGAVSYAETSHAPAVGEILVGTGRLAEADWIAAVSAGRRENRVKTFLERSGLSEGELEICVRNAIHDAAFFALVPAPRTCEFVEDDQHWLTEVTRVDAQALGRDVTRRRKALDAIHPSDEFDFHPVALATRAPNDRIVLSALQWSLIRHINDERGSGELARAVNQAGYTVVRELRHLGASGLIHGVVGTEPKAPRVVGRSADLPTRSRGENLPRDAVAALMNIPPEPEVAVTDDHLAQICAVLRELPT